MRSVSSWLPSGGKRFLTVLALLVVIGFAFIWLHPSYPFLWRVYCTVPLLFVALTAALVCLLVTVRWQVRLPLLGGLLGVLILAGWLLVRSFSETVAPPPDPNVPLLDERQWSCDLAPSPVSRIPSGTVIGAVAPKDWSQVVMRFRMRVQPDTKTELPAFVADMVNTFSLCFLTRTEVVPTEHGPRHRLGTIAFGLSIETPEGDRIVSMQEKKDRAALNFTQTLALTQWEVQVKQVQRVACTPNLWIIDTPSRVHVNDSGALITRRYAWLTSSLDGRGVLLFWDIDRDLTDPFVPDSDRFYRLEPGLTDAIPVQLSRKLVEPANAFALARMPVSTEFQLPPALRQQLAQPQPNREAVHGLEIEMEKAARLSREPTTKD